MGWCHYCSNRPFIWGGVGGGFVGVKRFRCFNFEGVVGGRLIP